MAKLSSSLEKVIEEILPKAFKEAINSNELLQQYPCRENILRNKIVDALNDELAEKKSIKAYVYGKSNNEKKPKEVSFINIINGQGRAHCENIGGTDIVVSECNDFEKAGYPYYLNTSIGIEVKVLTNSKTIELENREVKDLKKLNNNREIEGCRTISTKKAKITVNESCYFYGELDSFEKIDQDLKGIHPKNRTQIMEYLKDKYGFKKDATKLTTNLCGQFLSDIARGSLVLNSDTYLANKFFVVGVIINPHPDSAAKKNKKTQQKEMEKLQYKMTKLIKELRSASHLYYKSTDKLYVSNIQNLIKNITIHAQIFKPVLQTNEIYENTIYPYFLMIAKDTVCLSHDT